MDFSYLEEILVMSPGSGDVKPLSRRPEELIQALDSLVETFDGKHEAVVVADACPLLGMHLDAGFGVKQVVQILRRNLLLFAQAQAKSTTVQWFQIDEHRIAPLHAGHIQVAIAEDLFQGRSAGT